MTLYQGSDVVTPTTPSTHDPAGATPRTAVVRAHPTERVPVGTSGQPGCRPRPARPDTIADGTGMTPASRSVGHNFASYDRRPVAGCEPAVEEVTA